MGRARPDSFGFKLDLRPRWSIRRGFSPKFDRGPEIGLSSGLRESSLNQMRTKTKAPQAKQPPVASRKEMLELHERVLKRVRRMTSKEGFQSLIASGIYTPDGKLAKEYGG
jgi:hypothetical protein